MWRNIHSSFGTISALSYHGHAIVYECQLMGGAPNDKVQIMIDKKNTKHHTVTFFSTNSYGPNYQNVQYVSANQLNTYEKEYGAIKITSYLPFGLKLVVDYNKTLKATTQQPQATLFRAQGEGKESADQEDQESTVEQYHDCKRKSTILTHIQMKLF